MNPFPIILSSPSGGGKTTITKLLLERRKDVGYSVSCTTRSPRNGEVHERDYFFISKADFAARRDRGEFAESAEVHGNWYGTLRSQVDLVLSQDRHVIMDIDVQGATQFRAAYPESVLIFLLPPSAEKLMHRLTSRQTESEEAFRTRVRAARCIVHCRRGSRTTRAAATFDGTCHSAGRGTRPAPGSTHHSSLTTKCEFLLRTT
jgi:guanylate kinase